MLGPHTIHLVGPGTPGKHGQPGTPGPRRRVDGCVVFPRGSTEEQGRTATVITGMTVIAPPGTVVESNDDVEYRGEVYEVIGDVGEWDFFDGSGAGVQINIERRKD